METTKRRRISWPSLLARNPWAAILGGGSALAFLASWAWWALQLWGLPDIGDPFDVAAAQARNDRLRGLLSEVVAIIDTDAAAYRAIVEHMRTRAGRFPMRMVPDMPRTAGSTS